MIMNNKKIIWLTGQPGSGKTTLANLLKEHFNTSESYKNKTVVIVDGDDLRDITVNKDYSRAGRENNIRTAQKIAKFLLNKNFINLKISSGKRKSIKIVLLTKSINNNVKLYVSNADSLTFSIKNI